MFAALFSSYEDTAERHKTASQVVGHKQDLPLLPHSSARDGSGDETDGNAKAEGRAQGKAEGKTKTKAKALAKPKAEVQCGEEIDASPMSVSSGLNVRGAMSPRRNMAVRKWRALHKPRRKPI